MKQDRSVKEKVLHPEQGAARQAAQAAETTVRADQCADELDERICAALRAAGDKKALEPVVLDLRELSSFTDYFLITSGTNVRQVQAISDEVVERLKKSGTPALRVEGYNTAEWVLVDYGDFIVHVFEDKSRRFYDLERLWREARRVELPADISAGDAGGASSLRKEDS